MNDSFDIDLTEMPQGATYEDQYQGYLKIFEHVAKAPPHRDVRLHKAPWSWVPLLTHLKAICDKPRMHFPHCPAVAGAMLTQQGHVVLSTDRGDEPHGYPIDRTLVEVLCGFRPECADALWKCDVQWNSPRARIYHNDFSEFIVTNNGSFSRREVIEYEMHLENFRPKRRNVVLVPCAADKPYPAPMHEAVLERLPDTATWYVANVTGVVGIVPQELWPIMPYYDSGIPNRWRAFKAVRNYFKKHPHDRIVVYCDFYSEAIYHALDGLRDNVGVEYVLPVRFYADYENLMAPEHLIALERALHRNV